MAYFPYRVALIQRPSSFDALSAVGKRKQLHVLVFEQNIQPVTILKRNCH